MFLEFTNTKISNKYKFLQPFFIHFVAYHSHMITLKPPSSSSICSSKSLEFRNYGKAPYKASSYRQSAQVNVFGRLFT